MIRGIRWYHPFIHPLLVEKIRKRDIKTMKKVVKGLVLLCVASLVSCLYFNSWLFRGCLLFTALSSFGSILFIEKLTSLYLRFRDKSKDTVIVKTMLDDVIRLVQLTGLEPMDEKIIDQLRLKAEESAVKKEEEISMLKITINDMKVSDTTPLLSRKGMFGHQNRYVSYQAMDERGCIEEEIISPRRTGRFSCSSCLIL